MSDIVIDRQSLVRCKGMTVQQMEEYCPCILALIKAIVGDGWCFALLRGYWIQIDPAWQSNEVYFPTDVQLHEWYKPKEVDNPPMKVMPQVTKMLPRMITAVDFENNTLEIQMTAEDMQKSWKSGKVLINIDGVTEEI